MKLRQNAEVSAALVAAVFVLGVCTPALATVWNCTCTIDGTQEVPPNASPATGTGTFVLDDVVWTLDFNITFQGLLGSETAAHIHGPALVGQNAGVLVPLPLGSPKIGQAMVDAAIINALTTDLTYVNIHSSQYPGGEIRGQIYCTTAPTATENSTWGRVKQLFM